MNELELKEIIRKNPNTVIAQAYRLGRKDANIELTKSISKSRS